MPEQERRKKQYRYIIILNILNRYLFSLKTGDSTIRHTEQASRYRNRRFDNERFERQKSESSPERSALTE